MNINRRQALTGFLAGIISFSSVLRQTKIPVTIAPPVSVPAINTLNDVRLEEQFSKWVAMGEKRAFKPIADSLDMSITRVIRHSEEFSWNQRLGIILVTCENR